MTLTDEDFDEIVEEVLEWVKEYIEGFVESRIDDRLNLYIDNLKGEILDYIAERQSGDLYYEDI